MTPITVNMVGTQMRTTEDDAIDDEMSISGSFEEDDEYHSDIGQWRQQ